MQGHSAPSDIHPCWLQKEDGSSINYSQLIPYLSIEARQHWETLLNLQDVFADLFKHIHHELEECLPDEYPMLSVMVDILPGHNVPTVYPFQSLVLNVNVVTKAHKDAKDC
ncbi:hypothetical protein HYDPIDRAFT_33393 [Hydnomerulius pinastri MD-312]|uniref:Uncharacterized protein n=1 Tax=Hydnomerulius pinastri MD-312 TaxID=994086 RepID=A0A0C9W8B8_9AGAM|nr:hypothetical protein HYDPIDRAFT_33393 [Hydnomerulius pinastri MD-312]